MTDHRHPVARELLGYPAGERERARIACRCGHKLTEHRDLDAACTRCLFCDRFMEAPPSGRIVP